MPDDLGNVYQLHSDPAQDALDAMARYQAGIAGAGEGRVQAIRAAIAYGAALLAGRIAGERRLGNVAFKQWVSVKGLDVGQPWSDRKERHAAMQVAELVVGSLPTTEFDDCPNSRPTNIMKWYRAANRPPRPPRPPRTPSLRPRPATSRVVARQQRVAELMDAGLSDAEIAIEVGRKPRTVREIMRRVRVAREAEPRQSPPPDVDPRTLSMSAQARLVAATRAMEHRLNAAYAERLRLVAEEVRQRVLAQTAERLAMLHERETAAQQTETTLHEMMNNHQKPFTREQFITILMCLHPDGQRTQERLADAFRLFNGKKLQLTGER